MCSSRYLSNLFASSVDKDTNTQRSPSMISRSLQAIIKGRSSLFSLSNRKSKFSNIVSIEKHSFHKGVCLICGTVLVDRPFSQRRPWNVSFLSADRTPEPTGLSADIDQLVTVSFQLAPAIRAVEAVALSDRHIHNPHLNHAPYSAARRIVDTSCSRPRGNMGWRTAFSRHCRTDPL